MSQMHKIHIDTSLFHYLLPQNIHNSFAKIKNLPKHAHQHLQTIHGAVHSREKCEQM